MSNLELTGTVKEIFETQTFESGFQKRELVITTQEQYPQDVKLEFVQDKIDLLDRYNVGDLVKVGFNIRGNEFKGKYYVSLQGWKIFAEGSEKPAPKPTPAPKKEAKEDLFDDDSQELPF